MKRNLRRNLGVSFSEWYGSIDKSVQKKLSFLVWRDFYNDDFTPEEALRQGVE